MNIQRVRVPLGFLFAGIFLYYSQPSTTSYWTGLLIAATGLATRVWASGHLEKWRGLAVSGPYGRTRNPLYFGSLLLGLGFTVASDRPLLIVLFLILFPAIYLPVMRREEAELREAYGEAFETYSKAVPLFIPRMRPRHSRAMFKPEPNQSGFDWGRVIRNKEYKAVTGFVLVSCFLWLKMSWL